MTAITFSATTPDGRAVTRTSRTMAYKFAVMAFSPVWDSATKALTPEPVWSAVSWSQSEANAHKAARTWELPSRPVVVVPAYPCVPYSATYVAPGSSRVRTRKVGVPAVPGVLANPLRLEAAVVSALAAHHDIPAAAIGLRDVTAY